MLTVGSLFSGIEGFGLGFERAGARVVWHVEKDEACQRVIAHRFPRRGERDDAAAPKLGRNGESDVALFADVRTVGAHNLSAVDLVCGGFPCQDLSVAGHRAGLAGERSGLWHEFHRILSELRPRWVVVENVPGLLSSNGGRDMAVVLGGLAELGYGWAYRVLDAQYFGVAQRRRRVFIVGCLGGTARAVQVLFEPESCDGDSPPSRQARQGIAGAAGDGPARSLRAQGNSPHREDAMTYIPELTGTLDTGAGDSYNGQDAYQDKFVAHTLSSDGADASEDGTGRGTPIIVDTLRSHPRPGSNSVGAIVSNGDQHSGFRGGDGLVYPLATRGRADGAEMEMGTEGVYNALRAGDGGSSRANHLLAGAAVRRLTPVECERLQGFPDGWTAGLADSTRYRMLGNAVCVPVAHWIGVRITNAEAIAQS